MSGGGPAAEEITVTPSMVTMMVGESVTVTVSGHTFAWSDEPSIQMTWSTLDRFTVVSLPGATSDAIDLVPYEPYTQTFSVGCDGTSEPSGVVVFALDAEAAELETTTLNVTCEAAADDDTTGMGTGSSFPLVDTGFTFPDATPLMDVTGTARPEGLLVEFDLPADLPADSYEIIWTSVEGMGADGYWVGECSDDTAEDGRDPTCLIWNANFMVDVSQPTETTFGPQSISVPVYEIGGELMYTVDGRAEPVEFFTVFYAVRTPREELERHALDVDIGALLTSIGE